MLPGALIPFLFKPLAEPSSELYLSEITIFLEKLGYYIIQPLSRVSPLCWYAPGIPLRIIYFTVEKFS